jgi:hypothetical protein
VSQNYISAESNGVHLPKCSESGEAIESNQVRGERSSHKPTFLAPWRRKIAKTQPRSGETT